MAGWCNWLGFCRDRTLGCYRNTQLIIIPRYRAFELKCNAYGNGSRSIAQWANERGRCRCKRANSHGLLPRTMLLHICEFKPVTTAPNLPISNVLLNLCVTTKYRMLTVVTAQIKALFFLLQPQRHQRYN